MTRFNDPLPEYDKKLETMFDTVRIAAYKEGVSRMIEYIESIHAYPKLLDELNWAIEEGII